MESSPRLRKKQSWIGSIVRNVVAHSAITAKAAVDSVRVHIGGSSMPDLPEESPRKLKNTGGLTMPSRQAVHHRTYSAKNAIAMIRSHMPRRSLDGRRRSFSDLLHRSDSHASAGAKGRHKAMPSPERLLAIAAQTALPSSPIDVPESAPSLSLDLSPVGLFTAPAMSLAVKDCHTFPPGIKQQLDDFLVGSPHGIASLKPGRTPVDSVLMLAELPIAEARESLQSKLERETQALTSSSSVCQSPLPGANSAMEFDEHDLNAVIVKEPESVELSKHIRSSTQPLDALTATPTLPASAPLSSSLSGESDDMVSDARSAVLRDTNLAGVKVSPISRHPAATYYTGPPTPARSVVLAIRAKVDQRATSSMHALPLPPSSASTRSSSSSRYRVSRMRAHNDTGMTTSLLRARTDDAEPLLQKFAELFGATQLADSSSSFASSSPPQQDKGHGIGLAITTNDLVAGTAQPLSFPLQSEVLTDGVIDRSVDTQEQDLSEMRAGLDSVSSEADLSHDASSAWLDSSASVSVEDSAQHNHLSLIPYPDSSDEGRDDSSLFQY